jgi:hypothetical protein
MRVRVELFGNFVNRARRDFMKLLIDSTLNQSQPFEPALSGRSRTRMSMDAMTISPMNNTSGVCCFSARISASQLQKFLLL